MPVGAIPQNQLDSLPILTVAQVAEGGDVQVIGSAIYRSFSPTQLQINGAYNPAVNLSNGYRVFATPYLDLRGCSKHVLTLRTNCAVNLARPAFNPIIVYAQTRQGPADTPPLTYLVAGADTPADNAMISVSPHGGTTFPATTGPNQPQTMVWAWSPAQPSINNSYAVVIGANTRFVINFGNVGLPTAVGPPAIAETDNTFTAYLESS